MVSEPTISAVILNWNGGDRVLKCIDSVLAQNLPSLHVVVVDNNSSDGSNRRIQADFPDIALTQLGSNQGYAGGMNRGIEASRGDYVALLNFDVTLHKDYFRHCLAALESDPQLGGVTGKLLRPGNRTPPLIDTTGHWVYRNRRAVDRGEREPDLGQYDTKTRLFGVCGAAPCYRRRMLDEVALQGEYFDEDFFAYFEDFDLCWRAQLKGWHFALAPDAVGWHGREGSGAKASTFILACNHRNRWLTMLRNDHAASFFRHFPGILYTELRASLHMLRKRPSALGLAWIQFFKLLPGQWKKRRLIQRGRRVGWRQLEPWFEPYDYGIRATLRRFRERAAVR